jgi:hypothetical protein
MQTEVIGSDAEKGKKRAFALTVSPVAVDDEQRWSEIQEEVKKEVKKARHAFIHRPITEVEFSDVSKELLLKRFATWCFHCFLDV